MSTNDAVFALANGASGNPRIEQGDAAYPVFAAALYGFVERLLIPFGLHHIWNVPFFFQIGSFTDASGKVVHGDLIADENDPALVMHGAFVGACILGNIAAPDRVPVTIADKDRINQHGFDQKYGFRTRPKE